MVLPRWCWLGFRPWSAAVQFSKGSVDIGQHSAPPEPSQHYRVLDHSKTHSKPWSRTNFRNSRRFLVRVRTARGSESTVLRSGYTCGVVSVPAMSSWPHSRHSYFLSPAAQPAGGAGLAGGILTAQAETGGNGFGSLPDCDAFVWLVFFSQGSAAQPSER